MSDSLIEEPRTLARVAEYRTLEVKVSGYPDVQTPYTSVIIRPSTLDLDYEGMSGEAFRLVKVTVRGARVLKSGRASTNSFHSEEWYNHPAHKPVPQWLLQLGVDLTPEGTVA